MRGSGKRLGMRDQSSHGESTESKGTGNAVGQALQAFRAAGLTLAPSGKAAGDEASMAANGTQKQATAWEVEDTFGRGGGECGAG